MSEKIPFSLHNSDLFVNPKLRNTKRKKNNTNNGIHNGNNFLLPVERNILKMEDELTSYKLRFEIERSASTSYLKYAKLEPSSSKKLTKAEQKVNKSFCYKLLLQAFICNFHSVQARRIHKDSSERKRSSIGENNQLVSLHTSYLLPPLNSFIDFSKAIKKTGIKESQILSKESKDQEVENSKSKKSKVGAVLNDDVLVSPPENNVGQRSTSFEPVKVGKYELRSQLTIRSMAQPKQSFGKDFKVDNNIETGVSDLCLPAETQSFNFLSLKTYSSYSQKFLEKVNKGICSGISREFLLVTINLILFSIVAVVQRSNYGRATSLRRGEQGYKILCAGKMSNLAGSSELNTTELCQDVSEITPKKLNRVQQDRAFTKLLGDKKQKQFVGAFLGKSDGWGLKTSEFNSKLLFIKSDSFVLTKALPVHNLQKPTHIINSFIQPWYCIKACNISNNKMIATRSPCLASSSLAKSDRTLTKACNQTFSTGNMIRGSQYYLPFYKSQERVFAETDTLPSKKDTVSFQKRTNNKISSKVDTSECKISRSVLRRCFYKYGLLVVSSSKKAEQYQLFKEREKGLFTRLRYLDEFKQDLLLPEKRSHIVVDNNLHKSFGAPSEISKEIKADPGFNKNEVFVPRTYEQKLAYTKTCKKSFAFVQFLLARTASPFEQMNREVQNDNKIDLLRSTQKLSNSALGSRLADLRDFQKSSFTFFTTLKKLESSNPLSVTSGFGSGKSDFLISHDDKVSQFKVLLPVVRERFGFSRYLSVLNQIENSSQSHKKQDIVNKKVSFPSIFYPLKENLAGMGFTAFVQMRDTIPAISFFPDSFIQNEYVSGYKLPKLQEKEIRALFRKKALFHFYFNLDLPNNHTFLTKLLNQLTISFRQIKSHELVSQVLSTPLINQNGFVLLSKMKKQNGLPGHLTNQKSVILQKPSSFIVSQLQQGSSLSASKVCGVKMRYTQVNLNDTENIKSLFEKLGRDYEDYLRKPKDSLPALIISPSLEDDQEIEEEGIQIFRKRDLIKNKKINSKGTNNEQDLDLLLDRNSGISKQSFSKSGAYPKTDNFLDANDPVMYENAGLDRTPTKAELLLVRTGNRSLSTTPEMSGRAMSKSEMQNHKLLVQNALRQAQEEIDNIAKSEEKVTEKDKQVMPPLTRLEALYTIRNRERRFEEVKDLEPGKAEHTKAKLFFRTGSFALHPKAKFWNLNWLRSNKKAKMGSFKGERVNNAPALSELRSNKSLTKPKLLLQPRVKANLLRTKTDKFLLVRTRKQMSKNTSLPIFEQLFLYSDRPTEFTFQNQVCTVQNDRMSEQSVNSAPPKTDNFLLVRTYAAPIDWLLTPWLFSKLGDSDISSDRKHSFFGEMSLPFQKITAQEQKQIFQQKANPLLKTLNSNQRSRSLYKKSAFVYQNETLQKLRFCKSLTKPKLLLVSPLLSTLPVKFSQHNQDKNRINKLDQASSFDYHNTDFSLVSNTVPLSLLSQFSVFSRNNYKKNDVTRFQIGTVKGDALPLHSNYSSDAPKTKLLELGNKSIKALSDLVRFKNRISFYDNLSQNQACQSSAPKVKNTPLQSPVSHRVWQPKRMEPSTFTSFQRSKSMPILPRVSEKEWKNIMEWQLKKYFVEEDKRLLPLAINNKRNLKRKQLSFYLPWISLRKDTDLTKKKSLLTSSRSVTWPLTRNDLTESSMRPDVVFKLEPTVKTNHLWQKQALANKSFGSVRKSYAFTKAQLNTSASREVQQLLPFVPVHSPEIDLSNKCFGNCQIANYWRLPTQQTLYTTKWPVKDKVVWSSAPTELIQKLNKSLTKVEQKLNKSFCYKLLDKLGRNTQQTSTLPTITSTRPVTKSEPNSVQTFRDGVRTLKKRKRDVIHYLPSLKASRLLLFETVTNYSWLFIYTFVFVLMFKQLFLFVYKVGFQDFFINFLNSDFGRTITSEEFRYSVQNSPLPDFHKPKKRLQALSGLERNKVQLLEIVWFLRNKCQGRHGIRGVLLVGVPGVESVSVVQAIAGEANVPIVVQSLEKIAQDNEPQRQLEQLYMRAQKQAPCVLFLDQLDTIGARRDQLFIDKMHGRNDNTFSSPDEFMREDPNVTLNKSATSGNKLNVVLRLLTILDGITQSTGVVTIATAKDINKLDPALLRPKRFDKRIYLSLPNHQDRVHLFKTQTKSIGHIKEMPWDYLSLQTEDMGAADVRSAINYSLFRAVLQNSVHTIETLEYGINCVKSLTDKRIGNNQNSNKRIENNQNSKQSIFSLE